MNSIVRLICVSLVILLTGCVSNVELPPSTGPKIAVSAAAAKQLIFVIQGSRVSSSKDWDEFRNVWRKDITDSAASAGIKVKFQDSPPASSSEAAVLAIVTINDYRYVTQGSRFAVGIMTGNAFVDADVAYFELPANTLAGTRKYNTSSAGGQGIFSPMTEKQVKAICDDIIKEITQR